MGLFDGLKRTMNIAGSEISIVVEGNKFSQSDFVKGTIYIKSPEYRLSGNSISLELQESWTENINMHQNIPRYKTREKKGLYNAFHFEPESEFNFPFEFELHRNCRITSDETGWCLTVSMDIPNARDTTERLEFKVVMAKELLYIAEACEEVLNFKEDESLRKWDGAKRKAFFHFDVPKNLKQHIDYLCIEINRTEDGSVIGDLLFNLNEKSIGDYFRALRGEDFIRKELYVDYSYINKEIGNFDK